MPVFGRGPRDPAPITLAVLHPLSWEKTKPKSFIQGWAHAFEHAERLILNLRGSEYIPW
jgi:hypothetical protein